MKASCLVGVLAFVLSAAASAQQGQVVGRVLLAAGDTAAVRNGQAIRLAYNSPIEFRDVLRTGPASSLQVRFVDESLLSLRESTEFQIEEYRFAAQQDVSSERAFFRLLKGGFRAVTGLIGRNQNANYRVQTQTATIGIRGTDYAVRMCAGDCGANVKDGLYGSVLGLSSGTNQVTVQNEATPQPVVYGINQHFHVESPKAPPQQLLQPPTFVAVKPQGKAQAVSQGAQGSGGEEAGAASGASAESRPQAVVDTAAAVTPVTTTAPYTITNELTSGGTSALVPSVNTLGILGAWITPGDINVQDEGGGAFVTSLGLTLDASGFPTAFKVPEGCIGPNKDCQGAPSGTLGSPIAGSSGSAFPNGSSQGIYWGRWDTGTITDGGTTFNLSSTTQAHLMYGTLTPADVISARVGTLSLSSLSKGTHPTNNFGALATSFTLPTITIDFTNRTATTTPIQMFFPGQNWVIPSLSGTVTVVPGQGGYFLVQSSGTNTFSTGPWSCMATGCGSIVYGKIGGIFLGPAGDHAGVTISGGSGSNGFTTVRVYCPSGC